MRAQAGTGWPTPRLSARRQSPCGKAPFRPGQARRKISGPCQSRLRLKARIRNPPCRLPRCQAAPAASLAAARFRRCLKSAARLPPSRAQRGSMPWPHPQQGAAPWYNCPQSWCPPPLRQAGTAHGPAPPLPRPGRHFPGMQSLQNSRCHCKLRGCPPRQSAFRKAFPPQSGGCWHPQAVSHCLQIPRAWRLRPRLSRCFPRQAHLPRRRCGRKSPTCQATAKWLFPARHPCQGPRYG
ncbi:Uncharacterised protein [uncultured archaeon]|nr:Uncharacterised protein [uncultured archaeon]